MGEAPSQGGKRSIAKGKKSKKKGEQVKKRGLKGETS